MPSSGSTILREGETNIVGTAIRLPSEQVAKQNGSLLLRIDVILSPVSGGETFADSDTKTLAQLLEVAAQRKP